MQYGISKRMLWFKPWPQNQHETWPTFSCARIVGCGAGLTKLDLRWSSPLNGGAELVIDIEAGVGILHVPEAAYKEERGHE